MVRNPSKENVAKEAARKKKANTKKI